MDYLDFELEIGPGRGRQYPVAVLRSPAGEAREIMRFPFGELELQNQLQALQIALLSSGGHRRSVLSPEQQTVRDFGRTLFDALLTGEARVRYDVSLRDAALQGKGLRLKLRINTPDLAALPWEFLYDPRRAEYVCLALDTPVVRYVELPRPIRPLRVTPPLRILGVVASPKDLGKLNVDVERQRMEMALRPLQDQGLVDLTWLPGQTWRHLQQALRRKSWHVLHFIGHGGFDRAHDEGFIALADDRGETQRLYATQLGRLLANHRPLRLTLLNACQGAQGGRRDIFSSTASILVRRGLPAVVAMQYAITDRAAIEFARAFYESLVDGLPVDAAVVEARVAVSLGVTNTLEWGTPVLYMRAPDGLLFDLHMSEPPPPASDETAAPPSPSSKESVPATTSPAVPRQVPPSPTVVPAREPFEPELVFVPAGDFLMGSDPHKDQYADADEQPQHTVTLPDYYIGKTPVTNAQYLAFVEATGHGQPRHWENGKIPKGQQDHPVVWITWDDAVAYCKWLAEVTGKGYRLPSEAEWEKAARGTDGRLYPWGDAWSAQRCNTKQAGIVNTTPVGKYSPQGDSPYGCVDMAGNVWEWTSSLFKAYPYRADDGREDVDSRDHRVVRGGAFYFNAGFARCASRSYSGPNRRGDFYGFRVVVVASPFS